MKRAGKRPGVSMRFDRLPAHDHLLYIVVSNLARTPNAHPRAANAWFSAALVWINRDDFGVIHSASIVALAPGAEATGAKPETKKNPGFESHCQDFVLYYPVRSRTAAPSEREVPHDEVVNAVKGAAPNATRHGEMHH